MATAYNKVTKIWIDTVDGSELTPAQDWIVNPVFTDEALAMSMDHSLWTFDGVTINSPTQIEWDAILLTHAKDAKWRDVQIERDRRKSSGVMLASNSKWFHSDDTSRIQHLGLLMMGAGLPPGIMWKTMDGTFVEMTQAMAVEIFQTIASKDVSIFSIAEQHKTAVYASSDPGSYNHLTGTPAWPAVFGE